MILPRPLLCPKIRHDKEILPHTKPGPHTAVEIEVNIRILSFYCNRLSYSYEQEQLVTLELLMNTDGIFQALDFASGALCVSGS